MLTEEATHSLVKEEKNGVLTIEGLIKWLQSLPINAKGLPISFIDLNYPKTNNMCFSIDSEIGRIEISDIN